jgi:predicted small secreted protein
VKILSIIANIFAEQWVFMLIAVVAVIAVFVVKKYLSDFYQTFLKRSLTILSVLLIVLALLFNMHDLFLLVPIIVICCELFGYGVTGKIVTVLFVDFLLIQLDYRVIANITSPTVMTIVFYALQIVAAICIGVIMDQYIRQKQAESNQGKELPKDEPESNDITIEIDDLDSEIEKIMSSIGKDSED